MKTRIEVVFALLLVLLSPIRADGKQEKTETEELVYEGLTELMLLRDAVLQRYALMVTGETQIQQDSRVDGVPLRLVRIYRLQSRSKSKSFTYLASGRVVGTESSNRDFEYQSWTEYYQCGLQLKGRTGSASRSGYTVREKGQSISDFVDKNHLSGVRLDPFDDLVLHPMFIVNPMDQFGWIEQVYLREGELLSADVITQGDVVSKWRWKHHTLDFEIELTQSKAYSYLPVRVKYRSMIPSMSSLFGETEIRWKRHSGTDQLLPHIVKCRSGAPFGDSKEQHDWVFNWKLGTEIPDDFFECESDDFRLKFSPLYDFYFDTYGQPGGLLTGTPWKTPEELLADNTD